MVEGTEQRMKQAVAGWAVCNDCVCVNQPGTYDASGYLLLDMTSLLPYRDYSVTSKVPIWLTDAELFIGKLFYLEFFSRGIERLPSKSKAVIEADGDNAPD
ncbi:hypothetical protein TNCV_2542031 [Trichonephila clavipes]|nr:hypothetical protein TNCV_2542031 [Trichonephila clavipes]